MRMNSLLPLSQEHPPTGRGFPLLPEQIWVLFCLTLLVLAAALPPYEEDLLLAIYSGTGTAALRFWQLVSELGSGTLLAAVVAVTSLLQLRRRQGASALWLALGWAATSLTVEWLKWVIGRDRPSVPPLVISGGSSFPSGHAALASYVCLYLWLTLAGLASAGPQGAFRKSVRALGLASLAIFPGAVGYSRVVLGVHWPSDVLGGWALGIFFGGLAWLLRTPDRKSFPLPVDS